MKIYLAQINPTIGNISGNTQLIINAIDLAKQSGATIVLFPELSITGYPPEDFLLLPHFIDDVAHAFEAIAKKCEGITAIVGTVRRSTDGEKRLFNSAGVINNGVIEGYYDKILLPTYDVFDERRFFEPGTASQLWNIAGVKVGITICEDIWQQSELVSETNYTRNPITELALLHPDIVLNLSASPYSAHKINKRVDAGKAVVKKLQCPLFLCNQIGGNDSLIFDGHSFGLNKDGNLLAMAQGFVPDGVIIDTESKKTLSIDPSFHISEMYEALVLGVRDYFVKCGCKKACLGISGGIDSAVVACIAVEALGKENVLGVLMPSRFTSPESISDAYALAKSLGIQTKEVPIESAHATYLEILTPHFEGKYPDITEENLQARIRGTILMALSNKLGSIVLSTGNKSELAMGYSTLYGDMCGGVAVIGDVTKREVYTLAEWINRNGIVIPKNTILRAPSAELRPNQKDSDTLPEYDVIDNVLKMYIEDHRPPSVIAQKLGYSSELVQDLVKRIHCNEYKRRQSPPCLRVSDKAFSVGRHFPIVQRYV